MTGDEKIAYEKNVVEKTRTLVDELLSFDGGIVSSASVSTNTTGTVNLLST